MPRRTGPEFFGAPARIALVFTADTMADAEFYLELLVRANQFYLQQNPDTPSLYTSGVRFMREHPRWRNAGEERFVGIDGCLKCGWADCDDAVGWRVAEIREQARRENRDNPNGQARGTIRKVHDTLYHFLVERPDGTIEDPSKRLGMTGFEP